MTLTRADVSGMNTVDGALKAAIEEAHLASEGIVQLQLCVVPLPAVRIRLSPSPAMWVKGSSSNSCVQAGVAETTAMLACGCSIAKVAASRTSFAASAAVTPVLGCVGAFPVAVAV